MLYLTPLSLPVYSSLNKTIPSPHVGSEARGH